MPMKYVITAKWQTGAPQYEIRLRDWDTKFSVPDGAIKLKTIMVNETGEFISTEEGK
ncbi:MAG: DUF2092 domain-containing protein [Deltaproteobacteria bacterium]|nr:DUF2092 domain-containing protein [Deltaproteobacteria bacterium]